MFDIQRSFAAGEIAPALYGRADVARFSTALRTCRNFIVRKEGGIKNRTGTQFIAEVKNSNVANRLIKFVFNNEQSYVLVFGNNTLRFIKNGAEVQVSGVVDWSASLSYGVGDLASSLGINYVCILGHAPSHTPPNATYWYALSGTTLELPTQYPSSVVGEIKFEQSGDVLTLVHPTIPILELTRYTDTKWALVEPVLTGSPFTTPGNRPGTVTFYQQRRVFARTDTSPESIIPSQIGDYYAFTPGVNAADSFRFTLAGRGVNQVQHLIGVGGRFVALTEGGAWEIKGGAGGSLTPTAINAMQNSYDGAGKVRPAIAGNNLLYQQGRGSLVRAISYDFGSDALKGHDLTVFSSHLFNGNTLLAMDYQRAFDTVLWCVRNDGILLGMTYMPEQDVLGWHRHDTDGAYEDVCVVPEGNYDAVYVLVRRIINGVTKRYVERFADQFFSDISLARFLDSWLPYDGTNATATTLTLTGSAWTVNDTLTLTASSALFSAGDVGNGFVLTAGSVVRAVTVLTYTSPTVVSVRAEVDIPVALRNVATAVWSKAVDDISGITHLEGKQVSVLGDGVVLGSFTVSSGAIHLPAPYSKIVVGLPYVSEAGLLDIENPNGMTLIDANKQVIKVRMLVESTRGVQVSDDGVNYDDAVPSDFVGDDYAAIPTLKTGVIEVALSPEWNNSGRVTIRQTDPLPLTLLAAAPTYRVGKDT